ncbi:MAG TPA: DUF2239 family protein [Anaeromyxobacteraceae bacterium]|nr:DUF2239 family protein [Anaeromyxobacteraceae bacterium]
MNDPSYSAFAGDRLVASGSLEQMLRQSKAYLDRGADRGVLIFEDESGRQVDFDFRGSPDEVVARAVAKPAPGVGRPRLGVISREVSLLPQHWEWLEEQPNGISATLRRLVDAARKRDPAKERARRARDAASRFMTAMAGDRPGYEEAARALFAGDADRFAQLVRRWPRDVREHLVRVASDAFERSAT